MPRPASAAVRAFSRATAAALLPCTSIISRASVLSLSSVMAITGSNVELALRESRQRRSAFLARTLGLFCRIGLERTHPRDEPWAMWLLFRCLRTLIAIGWRDGALIRSRGSFVGLPRLVDLRPFPESAHLGVHRNAHDYVPLQSFRNLECVLGCECRDHHDDKNGNDEGWNKPVSHRACPSLSGVSRLGARHRPARRFASVTCAGVRLAAIRSYADRAW
jgi:hypothetical protein